MADSFVNDRYIVSRMVSRAIDHAYQSQIPKSGFPFAMLKLTVDTHAIDINVHPQKVRSSLVMSRLFTGLSTTHLQMP